MAAAVGPVVPETTIRFRRELLAGDEVEVTCAFEWGEGETFRIRQIIRKAGSARSRPRSRASAGSWTSAPCKLAADSRRRALENCGAAGPVRSVTDATLRRPAVPGGGGGNCAGCGASRPEAPTRVFKAHPALTAWRGAADASVISSPASMGWVTLLRLPSLAGMWLEDCG